MVVLTGAEYRESLKALSPEVHIRGERVDKVYEHPLLMQTINQPEVCLGSPSMLRVALKPTKCSSAACMIWRTRSRLHGRLPASHKNRKNYITL